MSEARTATVLGCGQEGRDHRAAPSESVRGCLVSGYLYSIQNKVGTTSLQKYWSLRSAEGKTQRQWILFRLMFT